MRCKAFETLTGTVACICAPMCTPIRLYFYFLLLSTVSCLPQSFDVRMPSFLPHYWDPCIMVGVWRCIWGDVNIYFSYPCDHVMCKHLFCNELWLSIFVLMRCLLCLRYGPCVCNKSSLLYYIIYNKVEVKVLHSDLRMKKLLLNTSTLWSSNSFNDNKRKELSTS